MRRYRILIAVDDGRPGTAWRVGPIIEAADAAEALRLARLLWWGYDWLVTGASLRISTTLAAA